jgi:hypothetical protein
MNALEHLYSSTETLIADRTRELGSAIDAPASALDGPGSAGDMKSHRAVQNVLKNQLAELAAALCNNMEDKLRATSRCVIRCGEGGPGTDVAEDTSPMEGASRKGSRSSGNGRKCGRGLFDRLVSPTRFAQQKWGMEADGLSVDR